MNHSRYSGVPTLPDGVKRVTSDPNYAYFSSSLPVYKILSNDTCQVQGVDISLVYLTIFMKKGFPYSELLNHQ